MSCSAPVDQAPSAERPEPAPAPAPAAGPAPALTTRRAGLEPGTRRQTYIVAAVIALLFYGSQILNEALPANAADPPPGAPVAIGEATRITPLEGWAVTAHDNGFGVRLEKGIVVIDLWQESIGEDARELASAYLDEALRPDSSQFTSSEIEVATTPSGTAARFTYQGFFTGVEVALEGEVTAIFVDGTGVVADAWSRQGDLGDLLGEVHDMLASVEFTS